MTRAILTNAIVVFTLLATLVVAFDITSIFNSLWKVLIVALLAAAVVVNGVLEIRAARKRGGARIGSWRREQRVANYMRKMIASAGTSAIFSRDLSWATGATLGVLRSKAESHSLTLVLPQEIPISKELASLGATVHYYPKLANPLRSRFTIVDEGKSGYAVAVGRRVGGKHVIEFITEEAHPAYDLAHDLFDIVRKM